MGERIERRVCIFEADYETTENRTSVRLWGITDKKEVIAIIDRSFLPYMYVEVAFAWKPRGRTEDVMKMIRELNELGGGCIRKVETVSKKHLGAEKEFIKITLRNPSDVVWLWDIIKKWPSIKAQYEYSIPFRKRYIIDRDIPIMEWVNVAGETVERKDLRTDLCVKVDSIKRTDIIDSVPELDSIAIRVMTSGDSIVSINMCGANGFRKVLAHDIGMIKSDDFSVEVMDTEKDMLERFVSIINERNPQMLITYNGDKIDMKILDQRSRELNVNLGLGRDGNCISFFIKSKYKAAMTCGIVHIDVLGFVSNALGKFLQIETESLNNLAKHFLGEDVESLEPKEIDVIWNNRMDLQRLFEYGMRETDVIFRLSKKIMPQIFEFANVCRQTVFDVSRMRQSQMIDWILVREAHRLDEIILNLPSKKEISMRFAVEPYEGGYNGGIVEGIHKNISVLEFRNLYPSIVLSHNISPEMVDADPELYEITNKVPESDHFFSMKKTGFVPAVVMHSINERKRTLENIKSPHLKSEDVRTLEARAEVLRMLANSVYGYFAYPGSRWYSRICASSVTAWGRYYMGKVVKTAEDENMKIVNADSYSVHIADSNEKKAKKLIELCNEFLPETSEFSIKGIYKNGIFMTTSSAGKPQRKRYALLDSENKLILRGFEASRRDWSKIAKETQEMVLLSILRDGSTKKAAEYVKNAISRLRKGDVDMEDLVIRNQLAKPIEKYDQNWPHVSAARKLFVRDRIITVGSIISYIISSGSGTVSERAEPYGYTENYDADYYINRQILGAVSKIMETANFPMAEIEEAVEEGRDQESLEKFFKKSFAERLKEKLGV